MASCCITAARITVTVAGILDCWLHWLQHLHDGSYSPPPTLWLCYGYDYETGRTWWAIDPVVWYGPAMYCAHVLWQYYLYCLIGNCVFPMIFIDIKLCFMFHHPVSCRLQQSRLTEQQLVVNSYCFDPPEFIKLWNSGLTILAVYLWSSRPVC